MSRKSLAAKSVKAVVALPKRIPEPPKTLTSVQADLWRLVMASPAGDMISQESYPVLVEYCRCCVQADLISEQLNDFDPEWAKDDEGLRRWDRLQAMHDRTVNRIASLATKLRITPQTRVHKERAGTIAAKGNARRPWQFENDA